MLIVKYTTAFKKDYKAVKKRGLNLELLYEVIEILSNDEKLPDRYKDHFLVGNYKRCKRMSYTARLVAYL